MWVVETATEIFNTGKNIDGEIGEYDETISSPVDNNTDVVAIAWKSIEVFGGVAVTELLHVILL